MLIDFLIVLGIFISLIWIVSTIGWTKEPGGLLNLLTSLALALLLGYFFYYRMVPSYQEPTSNQASGELLLLVESDLRRPLSSVTLRVDGRVARMTVNSQLWDFGLDGEYSVKLIPGNHRIGFSCSGQGTDFGVPTYEWTSDMEYEVGVSEGDRVYFYMYVGEKVALTKVSEGEYQSQLSVLTRLKGNLAARAARSAEIERFAK